MLIIFGWRSFVTQLAIVQSSCKAAGHDVAWRIVKVRRFFTVFFIPLIPTSTRYMATCTYCGSVEYIDGELAEKVVNRQTQPAIPAQPVIQEWSAPNPQLRVPDQPPQPPTDGDGPWASSR
jgi:hypothetical protein